MGVVAGMEETESIPVAQLLLTTGHLAPVGASLAGSGARACRAGVWGAGEALRGLEGGLVGALGAGHTGVGGGVEVVAGQTDGQGTVTRVHRTRARGGEALRAVHTS